MLSRKLFRFFPLCFMICLISCNSFDNSVENQKEFSFWTVGSSDINLRFGVNIYQALDSLRRNTGHLDEFLFAFAEEPLTANQIQERSGLTQNEVAYFISSLDSCNFIKKYHQNRWATTLPVVTDNQMRIIRKDLAPMANRVAQFLKKQIPQIRTRYEEVKSPLDPEWDDVSHLIIDKLIIDATFHSHLNKLKRESDARERDDQKEYVMPAFLLQRGENFSNFGCNWYKFKKGDNQRELYVLHGAVLNRHDIAVNRYKKDQNFISGLFNMTAEGKLDSLTHKEKELLKNLDWVSGNRFLVPIVKAGTLKHLMPMMKDIGKDAAEVAFAQFADLTDSYNKSTYSQFVDYKEDYIQVLIHSIFGLIIEDLLENDAISPIPKLVPESFGVYIVSGQLF